MVRTHSPCVLTNNKGGRAWCGLTRDIGGQWQGISHHETSLTGRLQSRCKVSLGQQFVTGSSFCCVAETLKTDRNCK